MPAQDPATQWRDLTEHYRRLTDDELIDIAQDSADLTDTAQQVLKQEISSRGLNLEPAKEPDPPEPEMNSDDSDPDTPDPYAEDCALVDLCDVWSIADALKLQAILVTASIPFYIGPEKAQSVDAITSNFTGGLTVKVMRIGKPYASAAMQSYSPADAPADEDAGDIDSLAIHCPKCHSEDVTLVDDKTHDQIDDTNERVESASKFHWNCDACGNDWIDEGIETKD